MHLEAPISRGALPLHGLGFGASVPLAFGVDVRSCWWVSASVLCFIKRTLHTHRLSFYNVAPKSVTDRRLWGWDLMMT